MAGSSERWDDVALHLGRLSLGSSVSASSSRASSLFVNIERGSDHRKPTVVWTLPYSPYGQQPQKIQIELDRIFNIGVVLPCDVYYVDCTGENRFELPNTLESGQRYRVTIKALKKSAPPFPDPRSFPDSYAVVGQYSVDFRAELTEAELQKLCKMAKSACYSSTTCRWLYRNKSPQYFSDMFNKNRGVMKVYAKDNSGDPASPINGQINGLFFMAEVEPGSSNAEPVRVSAFGSTRLLVPIEVLLSVAPNLYFSDYYCMRGRFHYVTLVATKTGSVADKFCKDHLLPKLSVHDSDNNPFLFEGSDGEMRVAVGTKIEVLFTEDIDVNQLQMYHGAKIVENVPLVGKGSSTPGGLPKNSLCSQCNLYSWINDACATITFRI